MLPPLPAGWQAVRHAILGDGSLAVLTSDADLATAWARVHASAGRAPSQERIHRRSHVLAKTAVAKILVLRGCEWVPAVSFDLETPFPLFDRLHGGDWLVVASRTERRVGNARVIARDGALRRRFMLGDGVEHVAVDATDRIWVGWFDEGVFGNDGWVVTGREWPPSANGIASFAADGVMLPDPDWPEGAESMADCYALTASADGAWVCSYPDFPIIRFVPGKPVRWWRNAPAGSRALAVEHGRALVAGGYAGQANRLALLALDGAGTGEPARTVQRWTLPLRPREPATSGHVWAEPDLLVGRGDTLHLVDAGTWRRWSVAVVDRALVDR